jgi:hypothetical protein
MGPLGSLFMGYQVPVVCVIFIIPGVMSHDNLSFLPKGVKTVFPPFSQLGFDYDPCLQASHLALTPLHQEALSMDTQQVSAPPTKWYGTGSQQVSRYHNGSDIK